MKTVLIADTDIGFMAAVSKLLSRAGYRTLPATGPSDIKLLEQLGIERVDALVVELIFPGASEIVSSLTKQNRSLRVVGVKYSSQPAVANFPMSVILNKPTPGEIASGSRWFLDLERALRRK